MGANVLHKPLRSILIFCVVSYKLAKRTSHDCVALARTVSHDEIICVVQSTLACCYWGFGTACQDRWRCRHIPCAQLRGGYSGGSIIEGAPHWFTPRTSRLR